MDNFNLPLLQRIDTTAQRGMHQLVNCAYRDIHGISHLLQRVALQAVKFECTARSLRQPFKCFADTL
ncbi:MAG: hypothetical protein A3J71_01625 [Pseudomonadales bacterium RIFCSPHIGHO2_02_FULL_60_43]|nr:MAG: hypothetical protein A3J71_01625 [Pseudomonadales bacterium RIFCSPHIGHO2_02_FULL_60_43]